MKKLISALTVAVMLLSLLMLAGCTTNDPATPDQPDTPAAETVKVTFIDSDGVTVLKEMDVEKGSAPADPALTRDGYAIKGYYATPALLIPYDMTAAVDADTSIFVAWQSSVEDTRAWMLAGSLRFYPENNWGHAWPQDDFLLQPTGEFNTFSIEVNLFAGDEFKVAVIDQDYNWADAIDSSALTERVALTGGEDAFASGANIKVVEDGKYILTLTTDAETLSLCKLSYERIGDADEPAEYVYDMKLWASFNNWEGQDMIQNGADLIFYCEADVPAEGGEFGVKNAATGDWYSSEGNTKNITLTEGHYMFFIELEVKDGKPVLKGDIVAETPAYYVVGTCGNGGWAADANASNTAYQLTQQADGTYAIDVNFTEAETADWAGNKVAFKVVYGCGGRVANENWHGAEDGGNFTVDAGSYTIVYDPATGTVSF